MVWCSLLGLFVRRSDTRTQPIRVTNETLFPSTNTDYFLHLAQLFLCSVLISSKTLSNDRSFELFPFLKFLHSRPASTTLILMFIYDSVVSTEFQHTFCLGTLHVHAFSPCFDSSFVYIPISLSRNLRCNFGIK